MENSNIKEVVIVGGGTAGWMAAAAMTAIFPKDFITVKLVESDQIGTVGVGEATIPQIQLFNELLGLNENEFVAKTSGTFKLGIEFVDWGRLGDRYIHPFGKYGIDMDGIHFHHFWHRSRTQQGAPRVDDYCLQIIAAEQSKFMRAENIKGSPLAGINYAFQFDAGLYAKLLREMSEKRGAERTEGKVQSVQQDVETGHVTSVTLEDGRVVSGDFFIDCTGWAALLTGKTLGTGYEDWSEWLPANRAIAMGCEKIADPVPYTRATAKAAGWQWRIPLQHRTGNGHVYCSEFISDDEALQTLTDGLDAAPTTDPKFLRFTTGRRKQVWNKNVLALGLAAGFMEPLESTSIHMIQTGLSRLMSNFPDKHFNRADIDAYNAETNFEYERVRDFLVLHYNATQRDDTEFWRHCQNMAIPDTLQEKLDVYKENARINRFNNELFNPTSWFAVLNGQNIMPKGYHPIANMLGDEALNNRLSELRSVVARSADYMPSHQAFIDANCKSDLAV